MLSTCQHDSVCILLQIKRRMPQKQDGQTANPLTFGKEVSLCTNVHMNHRTKFKVVLYTYRVSSVTYTDQ